MSFAAYLGGWRKIGALRVSDIFSGSTRGAGRKANTGKPALMDSVKADHGYNMDSKSVKNLLQTMSELDVARRRDFLQFTTGSPKLPIGGMSLTFCNYWLVPLANLVFDTGFKSLNPMFTVVCKPSEAPYTSDDYLPSVMTCVNYLKLPDYTDISIMKKRLFTAIKRRPGRLSSVVSFDTKAILHLIPGFFNRRPIGGFGSLHDFALMSRYA